MPSLPIPMIGSLFLGVLLFSTLLRRDRSWLFAGLLALCALQGVVISLAQHYGWVWAQFVQPVSASLIPPMAWITLQGSAIRRLSLRRDFPQILGPLFSLFCVIYVREFLNLWIPVLFVGYGIAIFVVLSKGDDALPKMRLSNGGMSRRIWQWIAASLVVSALSDVVIVLAQIVGLANWQPWVVSVFATFNLLAVGALSLSESLTCSSSDPLEKGPRPDVSPEQDAEIMARLEALVSAKQLYLDPELTLANCPENWRFL